MKQSLLLRNEISLSIKGPVGQLELALSEPLDQSNNQLAIICHPHPLYGGTMSNKVITTLTKTYQALGFITIRFNFRGIGESEGQYGEGLGEIEDLLAVIDFALKKYPQVSMALAGFSFGAYIVMKVVSHQPIEHLVTVAPPVVNFPMQNENPMCPWILVQGDQDEIVSASDVYSYANSRKYPPQILRFETATHFFHGHLKELQERLHATILNLPKK